VKKALIFSRLMRMISHRLLLMLPYSFSNFLLTHFLNFLIIYEIFYERDESLNVILGDISETYMTVYSLPGWMISSLISSSEILVANESTSISTSPSLLINTTFLGYSSILASSSEIYSQI